MVLPDKDYYYLQELINRWRIAEADLRYFSEHGLLEIQVWLDETMVKIFRNTHTEEGVVAPAQIGIGTYKGYAIVEPDELRKIFSCSPQPVVLFRNPHQGEAIKIHHNHKKPFIGIEDLSISRKERDRFEMAHGIEPTHLSASAMATPSFGGRPSVMHLIMREFSHRCQKNTVAPSLQKEADALELWAAENIQGAQFPKSKAIMNAIRNSYREYRKPSVPVSVAEKMERVTT
jgi:hypothetical protein